MNRLADCFCTICIKNRSCDWSLITLMAVCWAPVYVCLHHKQCITSALAAAASPQPQSLITITPMYPKQQQKPWGHFNGATFCAIGVFFVVVDGILNNNVCVFGSNTNPVSYCFLSEHPTLRAFMCVLVCDCSVPCIACFVISLIIFCTIAYIIAYRIGYIGSTISRDNALLRTLVCANIRTHTQTNPHKHMSTGAINTLYTYIYTVSYKTFIKNENYTRSTQTHWMVFGWMDGWMGWCIAIMTDGTQRHDVKPINTYIVCVYWLHHVRVCTLPIKHTNQIICLKLFVGPTPPNWFKYIVNLGSVTLETTTNVHSAHVHIRVFDSYSARTVFQCTFCNCCCSYEDSPRSIRI